MKHKWFTHPKFAPLVTCKHCGVVRRADGKNSPCKGKVRVELRENRINRMEARRIAAAIRAEKDNKGERD